MNIAAVLVVEGGEALSLAEVRATLAVRLPRVRRLRQRIVPAALGCGRPVWVDAADFDLSRHLAEVALDPGADAGGGTLCSTWPRALPAPRWPATDHCGPRAG